jgi:ketosteroid isomerase-like protein
MTMGTSDDHVAAVRRLFEAFEQEDDEALLDTLSAEVEWYVPDVLPYGGTFHGVEQVREYLDSLSSFVERGTLDTLRMIDAGDHVVVLGHWSSRARLGEAFDARFASIFEVRNGKIVRLDSHLDTARILHAFQDDELPRAVTRG